MRRQLLRVFSALPVIAYGCVLAAALVAWLRLGHWPRPSIDDPKYDHILGVFPQLHDAALSGGAFLWLHQLLPLCAVAAAFVGPRWLAVAMGVQILACFDAGGMIGWILD